MNCIPFRSFVHKLCPQHTNKTNIYNKIHVLLITFSPTCFGTHCAIFRENFFFVCPKANMSTRAPTRKSNNTISEGALAQALYLAELTKLGRGWEHTLPHHVQKFKFFTQGLRHLKFHTRNKHSF